MLILATTATKHEIIFDRLFKYHSKVSTHNPKMKTKRLNIQQKINGRANRTVLVIFALAVPLIYQFEHLKKAITTLTKLELDVNTTKVDISTSEQEYESIPILIDEDTHNNHAHDTSSSSSNFLDGKNDSVTHQNKVEMKLTNTTKSNNNDAQGTHTHMLYNEPNFTLSNMTRDIVYLHVGKTGGVSLNKVLKSNCDNIFNKARRKSCFEALPETNYQAALSNSTKTTVHITMYRHKIKKMKEATSYLCFHHTESYILHCVSIQYVPS